MLLLLKILIAWLLADFITGVVHWFEDRYMDSYSLNFLDSIAKDNDLHHRKPTAMLLSSGWTNMKSAAAFAWPLAALLWLFGAPLLVWLPLFFAAFGNLIHRWSHVPKKKHPRWIRGMQEFGLFISQQSHEQHHRSMKQLIPKHLAGYKFCGMTDWLNPVLDSFGFWTALEVAMLKTFGIQTTFDKLKLKEKNDAENQKRTCRRGVDCRGGVCPASRCSGSSSGTGDRNE